MARDRAMRIRDSAVENSWFAPLLGAGLGALAAKMLQSRTRDRMQEERGSYWGARRYDYEYGGSTYPRHGEYTREAYPSSYGAGIADSGEARDTDESGDGSGGMARAREMKDRMSDTADEVKGRLREGSSALRERLPDRETMQRSAHEDTAAWALGALALGAMFGLALPVSRREREMLEPARHKARELAQQAKHVAVEKGSEAMDRAATRIEGEDEHRGESAASTDPISGSSPPLH